jgi:lipopolysaccharide heptosyltransferase II
MDKSFKILVIRLSSIGDIVLTTPVVRALRRKYPRAVIDFLVMDTYREAIEGNPDITSVRVFNRDRYKGFHGIRRFSRMLRPTRYDLVIDLHAKLRSHLICMGLDTRRLRYTKRSPWKSLAVRLRLMRYHVDDTIVNNYFQPLSVLGISPEPENLSFAFTRQDAGSVAKFADCVVMAPGAANRTKKWPSEYFAELGRRLNRRIVLIGGPEDMRDLDRIRQHIGPASCENLAGRLSLKQSGALLAVARFVVANDSGPFHLARAGGRPVFVIFGPTDPDMFTFNPNETLIYGGEACAPCSLHGGKKCPRGHFRCMRNLTPEKVFNIIGIKLRRIVNT